MPQAYNAVHSVAQMLQKYPLRRVYLVGVWRYDGKPPGVEMLQRFQYGSGRGGCVPRAGGFTQLRGDALIIPGGAAEKYHIGPVGLEQLDGVHCAAAHGLYPIHRHLLIGDGYAGDGNVLVQVPVELRRHIGAGSGGDHGQKPFLAICH